MMSAPRCFENCFPIFTAGEDQKAAGNIPKIQICTNNACKLPALIFLFLLLLEPISFPLGLVNIDP